MKYSLLKSSLSLFFVVAFLWLFLPPEVNAQTCSGFSRCQIAIEVCTRNGDGQEPCAKGSPLCICEDEIIQQDYSCIGSASSCNPNTPPGAGNCAHFCSVIGGPTPPPPPPGGCACDVDWTCTAGCSCDPECGSGVPDPTTPVCDTSQTTTLETYPQCGCSAGGTSYSSSYATTVRKFRYTDPDCPQNDQFQCQNPQFCSNGCSGGACTQPPSPTTPPSCTETLVETYNECGAFNNPSNYRCTVGKYRIDPPGCSVDEFAYHQIGSCQVCANGCSGGTCNAPGTTPPTNTPTTAPPTNTPPPSGGSCGSGPSCGSGQVKIGPNGTCTSNGSCPGGYGWCYPGSGGTSCCWGCATPTPTPTSGGGNPPSCRSQGQTCNVSVGTCCSGLTCSGGTCQTAPSGGCGDGFCSFSDGEHCSGSNTCCQDCGSSFNCTSAGMCGSGGGGGGGGGTGSGPTPTPRLACGRSCRVGMHNDCSGINPQDGCTQCYGGTIPAARDGICGRPGQDPGGVCGNFCSSDSQCNGSVCSDCRAGRCQIPLPPPPTNTPTPTPTTRPQIQGEVYIDEDDDQFRDGSELGLEDIDIGVSRTGSTSCNGSNSWNVVTDEDGVFLVQNLCNGGYDVTVGNLPSGYTYSSPTTVSVSLSSTPSGNVGFAAFSVQVLSEMTGTVYLDANSNTCATGATPLNDVRMRLVQGNSQLDSMLTGEEGSVPNCNAGTYEQSNRTFCNPVGSGEYYLQTGEEGSNFYTILSETEYNVLAARVNNGSWTQNSLVGATYGSFSLPPGSDVDFCLASTDPWYQSGSGDVRNNFYENSVPAGQYATSGNPQSVLYSTDGDAEIGDGDASSEGERHWVVDGEGIANSNTAGKRGNMSYSYYDFRARQEGVDVVTLTCGNDCNFATNQLVTGVYKRTGDVTINSYTHSGGARVLLLVDGDVRIGSNMLVPAGQGHLIIAATGDITIDPAVGRPDASSLISNIDAVLSAEESIIVEGDGCDVGVADLRLNVSGALIANSLQPFSSDGDGIVENQRSLCGGNLTFPSLYVQSRMDFVSGLSEFYKVENQHWQELAP